MMSVRELDTGSGGRSVLSKQKTHASVQPRPMNRTLPTAAPRRKTPRSQSLGSSKSLTGRSSHMTYPDRQYPSASAALKDYIINYEDQKASSSHSYRRTVSDLLLPRTTLQQTVDRSLETGVRDTKNEFHRFNIRKLINDSYEQFLRGDTEPARDFDFGTSVEYTETSIPLLFHEQPDSEKESLDLASEISSSTDALLLANPYPVSVRCRDKPVPASLSAHLRGSDGLRQHFTKSNGHSLSPKTTNATRQGAIASHSQSLRRNPRQHHSGSTRARSTYLHSTQGSNPISRSVGTEHNGQSINKSFGLSRDRGRPIPAWVDDLDASTKNPKRLATLYSDTLLSADGHASILKEHQGTGNPEEKHLLGSNCEFGIDLVSSSNPIMERSLSVMSGTRPPPSWVDDLDTTAGTMPASLRILARHMKPSHPHHPRDLSGESTRRSNHSGRGEQRGNELSKPSSLVSDNIKPHAGSRDHHKIARTHAGTQPVGNAMSHQLHTRQRTHMTGRGGDVSHRRVHSASTDELISESPFGNGTSKIQPSVPSLSFAEDRQLRTSKPNSVPHPYLSKKKDSKVVSVQSRQLNHGSSKASDQRNGVLLLSNATRLGPSQLDNSTTTDSLIYSSPFGLDRDAPSEFTLTQPGVNDRSKHVSPISSSNSCATLKEEDLATATSLSSLTIQEEHLPGEETGVPPLTDLISESTVGESARADAMLRRADRIVENTQASLNTSSLLDHHGPDYDSTETEELLAGDRSFIMTKIQAGVGDGGVLASVDPATQKMMEKFLDDCLQTSEKGSPEPPLSQYSGGPLESLKNMLFKLQDMASQHTEDPGEYMRNHQLRQHTSVGTRKSSGTPKSVPAIKSVRMISKPPRVLSQQPAATRTAVGETSLKGLPEQLERGNVSGVWSQRNFEEEPGGRSIQRAMTHLSRLKTLVALDTTSPGSGAMGASPAPLP